MVLSEVLLLLLLAIMVLLGRGEDVAVFVDAVHIATRVEQNCVRLVPVLGKRRCESFSWSSEKRRYELSSDAAAATV